MNAPLATFMTGGTTIFSVVDVAAYAGTAIGTMVGLFAPRGDEQVLVAPAFERISTEMAEVEGENPVPVIFRVLNGAALDASRDVIVTG